MCVMEQNMPRLLLHMMDNYDPIPNRVAAGIEAGSLCYITATNPFNVELPLLQRCVLAGGVWFGYETLLNSLPPTRAV